LLAALIGFPAAAAEPPSRGARSLAIGSTYSINSVALRESRVVNVVLPAGYAKQPKKRYSVLYVIDGGLDQDLLHVSGAQHLGALWGRSSEAIVVGIETKDRRKELVGPTKNPELLRKYPTAGASKAFRSFIREEVKPLVQRSYRTNGRDAVLGESLAGLFILETYLLEPTLFSSYAAIDPSLWWDNEALSKSVASRIGGAHKGRPLYLAIAKEQAEAPEGFGRFVKGIRGQVSRWCLAIRPDLLHSTIYQQISPQALQFLMPPKEPAPPAFGFEVKCSDQS
jgi:predicted alpha/beta superfamily hydrolase